MDPPTNRSLKIVSYKSVLPAQIDAYLKKNYYSATLIKLIETSTSTIKTNPPIRNNNRISVNYYKNAHIRRMIYRYARDFGIEISTETLDVNLLVQSRKVFVITKCSVARCRYIHAYLYKLV